MRIHDFNLEEKVLIVAEIGNNHEGNFHVAEQLVRKAAECNVGAVKFQTFKTRYFVSPADKARYERLSSFELSHGQFRKLRELAKSLGLLFISTPLDLESAAQLEGLVDSYKIASGDNNFYPMIERICRTGKPIILSSGLSNLKRIVRSKRYIEDRWASVGIVQDLAVLHCISSYPAPPDQLNLAAIALLRDELGCTIGYSDHTEGVDACLVAVSLGARIIEKHFTLDKNYSDFRDHQLSADPSEMKHLVEQVSRVTLMLGKPEKSIQRCEEEVCKVARRSIVAAKNLPRSHRVGWEDLTWLRPAGGLEPGEESRVIGKILKRDVAFGEPLFPSDFE